jgi:hypothetical protein
VTPQAQLGGGGIPGLDVRKRAWLISLADILIPAAEDMPAASSVEGYERILGKVLEIRPDLADGVRAVVAMGQDDEPAKALSELEARERDAFDALGLALATAYYQSPDVRRRLGYPGQVATPIDPDATPDYEAGDLLGPVRAREPFFRDAREA